MGIKDLWSILSPFSERRPLYELQNKTVAVDLSCWICEAQNVTEYNIQPRMYLRNLYFRTCYLLLMNVRPVFVLEGRAPELKYDTIAERNAIQFKGSRPKTDAVKTGKDRSRFHFVLKQCEEMLKLLGLACVRGEGEAESLCAYLNEDGLVDGCISQDSDCFAYGAKVVYRNFSISQQGVAAASGGSVDVYDLKKLPQTMRFGRNKIVALALLCGCDYDDGVHGVGKDSVVKFFERFSDEEILTRLRGWRENKSLFAEFEREIANKNLCTSCGHMGKLQGHTRNGCVSCGTKKGCDFTRYREKRLAIKNELNMRSKALEIADFPNERLINEFLVRKDNISNLNLRWKRPDIVNFVKFADKFLTWEEDYAFEKFLPILTRWQVLHYKEPPLLRAQRIKKIRNPKGVACYEIIWVDIENVFKGLIDNEKTELSSIEPQELIDKAYPDLVEAFKQSKIKPKKRKKATKTVDELEKMLQNTSISEPKAKKRTKTIDSYFKRAVVNNCVQKTQDVVCLTPVKTQQVACSTPIKSSEMNLSIFDVNENDADLSDVVNEIVQEKPVFIFKHLREFGYAIQEGNNASFFINEFSENDAFEKTFNELCGRNSTDEDEDSFVISELPLIERLQKNKTTFKS